MSTTPSNLESQLDELIKQQNNPQPPPLPGAPPPAASMLKFGDTEVNASDPVAIQRAYDQATEKLRREAEGYKQLNDSYQKRFVPNDTPPPPPAPYAPPPQSNKWSTDDWAKVVMVDPVQATSMAIAKDLGLPEGTTLKQVLSALAVQNQQQSQQLQAQTQLLQSQLGDVEADRFMRVNTDYDATPENLATIDTYLQTYGLQPNQKGYEAAWALAKAQGKAKTKNTPAASQVHDPNYVNPGQARVASLRNTQVVSNAENDWESLRQKLDQLPTSEVFKFNRNYYDANNPRN